MARASRSSGAGHGSPSEPSAYAGGSGEREGWLATVVRSLHDGVIATGADGRVRLINPSAQALTGWTAEEAANQPIEDVFQLVDGATHRPIECPGLTVLREGRVVELTNHVILVSRDGTERAIDDSGAPILREDGSISGGVLCFRDFSDQRRAEAAVAQLATIVESSDDAIFSANMGGMITSWNEAAERIFGFSAAEAIGQPLGILVPEERGAESAALTAAVKRGERISQSETQRRRKDGTLVDVSAAVSPLRGPDGRIVGISEIARDITQQKRAEEAIRESERRYRLLFDAMAQGVCYQSADGKILEINRAGERILGLRSVALKGQTSVDLESNCTREDGSPYPGVEHPSMVALRTGQVVRDVLMRVSDPQGTNRRWINITAFPLMSAGETRPEEVCTLFDDITVRKAVEDELRSREAQLRMALEAARMVAWDRDFASDRMTLLVTNNELFGIEPGTYPAEQVLATIHPDDRAAAEAVAERAEREHSAYVDEFRIVRPDGSIVWAAAQGRYTYNDAGEAVGMLGVTMDVTERKHAETRIKEASERLKELSRRLMDVQEADRRELARELHDEIGQALTAVKINLQQLRLEPESLGERLEESLGIVDETLQQVRGMALDLRPSLLDDLGLVATLQWYVERHARRTGIDGRFVAEPEEIPLPPAIETACFRLAQEALTNVARHSGATRYRVGLRKLEGGLALTIADDGRGFDPSEELRRASRGASLGLLGMVERAELLGGRLSFVAAPGQGTEVRVFFPDTALERSAGTAPRDHP